MLCAQRLKVANCAKLKREDYKRAEAPDREANGGNEAKRIEGN
jgi:hypothetical protein